MYREIVDKKHSLEALKEMIADRKPGEPVEEVLAIFCERYGLSVETCQELYEELVSKGEIKEK
jgi:hypothetical protein